MADYLSALTEPQVAGWYRRLADTMAVKTIDGQEPMASQFLRMWLDNGKLQKDKVVFVAPKHLKESDYVINTLYFHRRVFITEEKARLGKTYKWAGIVPRIQDGRWDMTKPLDMTYQSLVEVGSGTPDIIRIQYSGTSEEKDLFASLRGFQLKSSVRVQNAVSSVPGMVRIIFSSWKCLASDRYDFAYNEHLTLPNPDYQSTAADAVRPQDDKIRVYHINAKRLEDKNLAKPYDLEMEWDITNALITAFADINPSRVLN